MRIDNIDERHFYEIESVRNNWSLTELKRQFDSSLYERLALSTDKNSIKRLATEGQIIENATDMIKDPYVLEFLGLEELPTYSENELETRIIDNLERFLLELGKGYTFVGRQVRLTFDEEHFKVDLVFFNRILRCFVLFDLKIGSSERSYSFFKKSSLNIISGSFAGRPKFSQYCLRSIGCTKLKSILSFILRKR